MVVEVANIWHCQMWIEYVMSRYKSGTWASCKKSPETRLITIRL